jgi:hypothetical protein
VPVENKTLLFFAPRTRIGFGFPASAAFSQNLKYLILNHGARGRLRRLVWCGHFIDGAEKGGAIERAASSGWHQIISNAVQTLGAPKSIVLVGREHEDHQRVEHEANGLSSVTASTLANESDEHVERQCRNPLSGSCRAKLHPARHRASAVYEKRTGSI